MMRSSPPTEPHVFPLFPSGFLLFILNAAVSFILAPLTLAGLSPEPDTHFLCWK